VLELADDEWQSIFQIGATPKGRRGTRAADGAARRACKRLAEQGHIELGYRSLKVGGVGYLALGLPATLHFESILLAGGTAFRRLLGCS